MLSIKTLKENYIDVVLAKTGLPFSVYIDTGDFQKAIRSYNTVTEFINGLFVVTGSSVEYAGEQEIVSISTELKFLVSLNDDSDPKGNFENAETFREVLSSAFSSVTPKFNITENGKTYTVVVGYNFPVTGVRDQLPDVGDSISFTCSVYFAYLSNAVNASDISLTIDGEKVYFLAIALTRRPSLVANLFADNVNGESTVYSESAAFVIDLTLPAFISNVGDIISDYILGLKKANTPHAVVLDYGGKTINKMMIFGETSAEGQGIENIRYNVSLVPYAAEATAEG